MRAALRVFLLAALALALAGCPPPHYGMPLAQSAGPRPVTDWAPKDPAQIAHMSTIARLQHRAIGPMLVRGRDGALVVYVSGVTSAASRQVVALALSAKGVARAQARVVAETSPDTSTLVARRVAGDYLVAWTQLTDRGESLSLVGVGGDGAPLARAIELTRTTDHIVWVEIVRTPRGAVCVWAEEGPTGDADVLAQALDASGAPRGVPSRVARGCSSWQAVSRGDGVALGVIAGGTLELLQLDAGASVVSGPVPIARKVGDDMDFVASKDGGVVFAWTDRTRPDPQLVIAGVDSRGRRIDAHDALPDAGSSSFVAIAPRPKGAALIWENAHKRDRITRRVFVAEVTDASAAPVTRTTLDLAGGAIEVRPRGDGLALLVTAPACDLSGRCGDPAPTFVRLDSTLTVVQTEAMVAGPPVSLAWSLDCGKDACLSLAAGPSVPTTVYAVDLSTRPSTSAAPVPRPLPDDAPRLDTATTIAGGTQVDDVASARVGGAKVIAWLLNTPAAGASKAGDQTLEPRATLRAAPFVAGKVGAATTLTTRALLTGGISMVSAPGGKEAVVAFVAKEPNARVHVVRVDARGARRGGATLGAPRGEASDVSITATADGYVVAWVDTRDGNGEVYAAKLRPDLSLVRETRVTHAPGDATDTALVTLDRNVVLAWADPRESPTDGFADIYAVALSPRDGKPLAPETRVLSTAAHSRSPVLAKTPRGAALAWIEEAPVGAASQEARGAMFALLDESAHAVRAPIKLQLRDDGVVTAIALDTDPAGRLVHAVAARVSHDELWLDAVRVPLDASGAVDSYPLLVLDGPSSMDEALALHGDDLFFSDDGPDPQDARLRRGALDWRK